MKNIFKSKHKLVNALLLITSVLIFVVASHYLENVCLTVDACDLSDRRGIWLPLKTLAIYLGLTSLLFLFTAEVHSKRFFRWFLWWYAILALLMILSTQPEGAGILSLTRNGITELYGIIGLVVAVLFVVIGTYKSRKKLSTE